MRRKDREVTDRGTMDAILRSNNVCHLAMVDDGLPYVVPMTYTYDGTNLFFHSAREGRKIDALRRDGRVCFSVHDGFQPAAADQVCLKATRYRSVIGTGAATFVDDDEEKRAALDMLMEQTYGPGPRAYVLEQVEKIIIIKVRIEALSCKISGR
jgi:nitroimidazol reductase NimA-like FMN-containing flavoprotein (pyridoxamine 5'-phosphate oxidase superfamily)